MTIQTSRLTIRPFTKADLEQFRWLLDIPEVPGWNMQRERAEEFLAWHIGNYAKMDVVHGVVCFGMFDAKTSQVLGAVGAGEHDDLHEPEIFFNLLPCARGKGYSTEGVMAVTEWVFSNYEINYLIATAEAGNVASQYVLGRCGYQFIDERELLVHILKKRYTCTPCSYPALNCQRIGF